MTPSQTKKLRKFVGAWVLRQRKKMELSMEAFGDLIGRSGWQVHSYETGKSDVPFSALLAISYEADCTIEETQELFEAYAAIRAPLATGKVCTGCGQEKAEEDFALAGGPKSRRRALCRACTSEKDKARAQAKKGAKQKARNFPPFKGYAA